MKRTKLTIQFPGNVSQWNPDNVELPVEVRRSDSALVGRTLASGSLDVGPGTYVARAFAQGGEFAGSVEVPPGQAEAHVLLRFYDQSSPGKRDAADASLAGASQNRSPSLCRFDLLEGHLLQGRPLAAAPSAERDANGRMHVASSSGSTVLRVKSQAGGSNLIASIPQSIAAHLAWEDASHEKRLDVAFHFDHPQAQLLLSYLRTNALADARLAARSTTLTATQLLRGKKWDPLAGALGAYVLLRQSDNDAELTAELNQRSEQLCKYNSPFPDAWCIQAECRARAGEHAKAFESLLELNNRGLPFFSDGLRIAGVRLFEYLEPGVLPELEPHAHRAATALLHRLRWLGLHALAGEPILKLANFDPGDAKQYQEFWRSTAD